jgi:hypothetical protein
MRPPIWECEFLDRFTDPLAAYKSNIEDQTLDAGAVYRIDKGANEFLHFVNACHFLLYGKCDPKILPEHVGKDEKPYRLLTVGRWNGYFDLDEKNHKCVGFLSKRQN